MANLSSLLTPSGVASTDSPALTGTPTAPTAAADTNTTQIATTAFVQTEISDAVEYKLVTTNYTAGVNEFVAVYGTTAPVTVTLPPSPTAGDRVTVIDVYEASLYNVTIDRNGNTINGDPSNFVLEQANRELTFVYNGVTWIQRKDPVDLGNIDGGESDTDFSIAADIIIDAGGAV